MFSDGDCLLWAVHFYKLVIDHFDPILDFLHTWDVWCCDDVLVSVSWCAEHSGYTRHSRHSCSRSRRRAWPEPPSHSCDVCPGSFHLWTGTRRLIRRNILYHYTAPTSYCNINQPDTCGLQGIGLQICSCSGLVFKSHWWLCFLACVRQRTSLICRPFPQEREHWEQQQGSRESVNNTSIN